MTTQEVQNDEGMGGEEKQHVAIGLRKKKERQRFSSVKYASGLYVFSAACQHDLQLLL